MSNELKIKKTVITLLATLLVTIICLSSLCGCSPKETPKDKQYLYNWLLENGELVNGTELMYQDNTFTLRTDHSQGMFVDYVIPNYNGYEITVQLPLFSESENTSTTISVQNEDSSTTLTYCHTAKDFTTKSPIKHDDIHSYPPLETIIMDDYGTFKYENGKLVFHLDESKREEYEQKTKINKEIKTQQELRENIAKELAHETLCEILDWLNDEICPLTEMDISDFGYNAYKNDSNK